VTLRSQLVHKEVIDASAFFTRLPSTHMNQSLFLSPDLYKHKFIDCRFINSTFLEQKEGCHMDFEEDNDFLIYLVSFLGSLSVLPGNIISALLMDRIGRLKMIGKLLTMENLGLLATMACFLLLKKLFRARKMAQQLRALNALLESLSSIPSQPHGGSQLSVMRSDALFWCVCGELQCTLKSINL